MGFLPPKEVPHGCVLPNKNHLSSGVRWQCDDCLKIFELKVEYEYNERFTYWVIEKD